MSSITEKQIPQDPGVYLMKNKEGKIIYIGKAKNIRKRLKSYFLLSKNNNTNNNNWKTCRLISNVADIEFVLTDNEIEAFLLESNLIKRFRPLFNIELKDQQRYTYLKITDEVFPRLLVARRNRNGEFHGPKGKIYGPFVRGSSKFLTVGLLRKLFKIRICDKLPKKPCLEYFIKNCDAPCINNLARTEYMRNVIALQRILEGKSSIDNFINEMEYNMKQASELQQYEKAMEIRDTLHRLNNLRVKQKMEKAVNGNSDEEYIGIVKEEQKGIANIMTLRRTRGVISDRKRFEFELVGDNSISTFISQYYSTVPVIPRFIYVNEEPESKQSLEELLEKLAERKVSIIQISSQFPMKEKRQLMELILRNINLYAGNNYDPSIVELKKILQLPTLPYVIDCFDISNFGTTFAVGSCTRFINGHPNKAGYRKFRIKTKLFSQNDFAMIEEIVTRRYSHYDEKINSKYQMPDLVVIDGGKGQLHSAINGLHKLVIDIPCISLAKENEEIYTPYSSEPIILSRNSPALKMLQHIRNEAHRFGLAYNVNLRKFSSSN
ncbi:MAG: excinuclease ABC subunit UvrC [Nitrososphaeraceae archaeon]|nr:excinuclease ABC subunit UvrC [Nitrososphaeraceae archaeon]